MPIFTRTGSRRWRRAMPLMRGGSVAENSTVCRSTGVACEDRLDVLGEAHVEHLVGLVEHHHLDPAERQRAAPDVVERPTGRGDDDMDAARQRVELRPDRLPAVDRHDAGTELAAVLGDRLRDLHRQLARRDQDQGHRGRPARRGECAGESAARRPPSCRCRWRPGRADPGPAAAAESPRAGSASALRTRGWRGRPATRAAARAQRTRRSRQ